MDPFEAGKRVLTRVQNNDLFIISHVEYEEALNDSHEALIASIPRDANPPSRGREAIARLVRNPIYARERDLLKGERHQKT